MKDILDVIEKNGLRVYAVTVIRQGQKETVYPRDYELNSLVATVRNIYSVSKSFTMLGVGFCYDDGLLTPDTTIGDVFGTLPEGADPLWGDITVDNLLRHETGCLTGNDLDCENLRAYTDGDWLDYILYKKIEEEPGRIERYSDNNFFLLSCMITKLTGKSLADLMRKRFFNPAKFREAAWSSDPKGRSLGGTALYISTDDMAKLGQLWIQDGLWDGKRLISKEWVRLALERRYTFSRRSRTKQTYGKGGMLGQMLMFSYADQAVLAVESYAHDVEAIVNTVFPEKD